MITDVIGETFSGIRARAVINRKNQGNEKNNCRQARPLHASLLRKAPPNRSEAEFAAIVTTVTIMVKLISRYKSRPKAAFQANCPIPGRSQRTSTGIEAPKARLTETPARARS